MSRPLRALLVLLVLTMVLVLGFLIWWQSRLQPVSSGHTPVSLVIRQGDSASAVIENMFQAGLIKSPTAARIYFRLYGSQSWIQPGAYVLSSGLSVPNLFAGLSRGPKDIWVTIPEGWRREQISARLAALLPDFDRAGFASASAGKEGWLFPDTYLFPARSRPADIVGIFLKNFTRRTGLDPADPATRRILIIASLIEREAKTDTDRGMISGIIHNRLESDWLLQIDAAVQYAAASLNCSGVPVDCDWWPGTFNLQTPSLYNTYLHSGLPPAPICNPGLASIRAAQSPVVSPYWYYLTGTDGVTRYAVTHQEHLSNIDKYLRH